MFTLENRKHITYVNTKENNISQNVMPEKGTQLKTYLRGDKSRNSSVGYNPSPQ